jgi:hypothetical protein
MISFAGPYPNATLWEYTACCFTNLSNRLPEDEITDLEAALAADDGKTDNEQKRFGPAVTSWLDRMLRKAADTSWQIELAIAANAMTTALQKYYGWLS